MTFEDRIEKFAAFLIISLQFATSNSPVYRVLRKILLFLSFLFLGHHQRRGGYNNGNHYYRVSKEEKFRGNGGGNGSGNQHQRPNSGGHKK